MALGGAGVVGVGRVKILPDMAGFKASVSKGVQNSMATTAKKVGRTMAKAVTTGVLGIAGASVKLAVDVEKSLRSVNSLFGLTGEKAEKSFRQMQKGVADLSSEMGIAQDVLSEGLYQAISAGVPKENAFTFMRTAAKAAVAGVTDTNTAVEGISKVINAFGLKFSDAEMVADSMFTTVNKGIVTFEEMSQSMFQVAPAAAAAGIGLKETNAAITALTLQGIPMAEAATRVQAALVAVARNGKDLDPIFKKLGIESAEAALKQKGLQFVLDAIYKSAGGAQSKLLDYLGRIEAVQATNVLAGAKAGVFTQALKDQEKATGASSLAFKEMEKSAARKLERALTDLKNAGIQIGNVLIPIVSQIAKKVSEWAKAFSNLNPETRKTILLVAGLTAAVGPLVGIVGRLGFVARGAIAGVMGLGKAIRFAAESAIIWKRFGFGMMVRTMGINPFVALIAGASAATIGLTIMASRAARGRSAIEALTAATRAAKSAAEDYAGKQLTAKEADLAVLQGKNDLALATAEVARLQRAGAGTTAVQGADLTRQQIALGLERALAEQTRARADATTATAAAEATAAAKRTAGNQALADAKLAFSNIAANMDTYSGSLQDQASYEAQVATVARNVLVPALAATGAKVNDVVASLGTLIAQPDIRKRIEVIVTATVRGGGGGGVPSGHKGLRLSGGHKREGFVWARGGETIRTAQQEQQLGIFMRGVHERMRQQRTDGASSGPQTIRGRLSIDERGQAYIYGVARGAGRDEMDDRDAQSTTARRMVNR